MGWFSTPPHSDGNLGVEEGPFGTQASVARGPNLSNSAKPLPHGVSSHATSPAPPSLSEVEYDAKPSTSATTSKVLSSSSKSPLTTGERRGTATYAYRTAPPCERGSPVHPTSIQEFSSAAIPPIPVPSTSRHPSRRNLVMPSEGPSEPRNYSTTSKEPPSNKRQSNRRRRREELKEVASSPDTVPRTTTKTPTPPKNTPTPPIAAEDRDICDPSRRDDGQIELDTDVTVMPDDMQPEQVTVVQSGGEQAGWGEGDATGEIVNADPSQDDPVLSMRAGLKVNNVSVFDETISLVDDSVSQWPYTALSDIRPSALMSVIGVVSSVTKEPTQSKKGGTDFPRPQGLCHSRQVSLRLVHLLFFTGSVCPGLVWRRSPCKRCGHQNQLFHEIGAVASKPEARRRCHVASHQGAAHYDLSRLVVALKTHIRLSVGTTVLPVPATQIGCSGQVMILLQKRYYSRIPTLLTIVLITHPLGT